MTDADDERAFTVNFADGTRLNLDEIRRREHAFMPDGEHAWVISSTFALDDPEQALDDMDLDAEKFIGVSPIHCLLCSGHYTSDKRHHKCPQALPSGSLSTPTEEPVHEPEDAVEKPAVIDAEHLTRMREFSERTFGPGARAKGVVEHIRRELLEVEADPTDLGEWVDVVILALDGAWRAGYLPQEIIDAIVAKQDRNEARTWPDWRTADPDQPIEHDRSRDEMLGGC